MKKTDTIAAIATARGESGIGIIRITGDQAFNVLLKIFKSKKVKKIEANPQIIKTLRRYSV